MKFIIDRSKWRCGGDGEARHGQGETYLLNEQGYMCCLGMICLQIDPQLEILDLAEPDGLTKEIKHLNEIIYDDFYKNTSLSNEAMKINDRVDLTDKRREILLTQLFNEHGISLEFVNDYAECGQQCENDKI